MATIRQQIAAKELVENGGSVSNAMRVAGYSEKTIKVPGKLTQSEGWKELMEETLSDEALAKKHQELLNSTRLDHMVFPMGPKTNKEKKTLDALPTELKTILDAEMQLSHTDLSDEDIKELLASVNCTVRRIVHGETARHVYFWSADNKARKEALDMAYKLKGKYAPEKSVNINIELEADTVVQDVTEKLNALYRGTSVPSDGAITGAVDTETQNQE